MNRSLEVPYVVVDVFTQIQFGGNQLAVVPDGRGLSDSQMQRIANEFNFSETTFVLPPTEPGNTARVRIFNRTQEMAFAGHPNVGTAFVLARQGNVLGSPLKGSMRFEELAGLVAVEIESEAGEIRGASIEAPRALTVGQSFEPASIANCLSLTPQEMFLANHTPTEVSVGIEFVVAEIDPAALSKAMPNITEFRLVSARTRTTNDRFSIFVYARENGSIERLRARMFAPLSGTHEDPATGSASGALGAYLASLDSRTDHDFRICIEQGVEMGRPSEINVQVRKAKGKVQSVKIAGRCVQTMRGVLDIA